MTSLVLTYQLRGQTGTVTRTLCTPFKEERAAAVAVRIKVCTEEGIVCLAGLKKGRRVKMTLGCTELHVFSCILKNVVQVQLLCPFVHGDDEVDKKSTMSRKEPRELVLPRVVNLCSKSKLKPGDTVCRLTPACIEMQLAKAHKSTPSNAPKEAEHEWDHAGFEIGTTGKGILSSGRNNAEKGTVLASPSSSSSSLGGESCIRVVGTDDLHMTTVTLSHLCNIDVHAAPSVHMGIFCVTLPHSTRMTSFRTNIDYIMRLQPNMFTYVFCVWCVRVHVENVCVLD